MTSEVTGSSSSQVWVLNGVNLGRLGKRQPEIYGSTSHQQLVDRLLMAGQDLGLAVAVRQSDSEREMIEWLHQAADQHLPVVINPGAWSHYSLALADAAREIDLLVEVHLSNIYARESFRSHSVISPVAKGVISGLGIAGYEAALAYVATCLNARSGADDS
ncbi:MAG: 3-dehydroquinate dehydratase [Propionibacteriaceae bacterium]|nr:3-dehydroquinate dehydratase [Propionibacteriaceae bacterium]